MTIDKVRECFDDLQYCNKCIHYKVCKYVDTENIGIHCEHKLIQKDMHMQAAFNRELIECCGLSEPDLEHYLASEISKLIADNLSDYISWDFDYNSPISAFALKSKLNIVISPSDVKLNNLHNLIPIRKGEDINE